MSILGTARGDAVGITVELQDNSPVEVVICRGFTNVDLLDFEERITESLVAEGVARERIRVIDGASIIMGSSRDGLQQMIDNFYVTPAGIEAPRIIQDQLVGPGPDTFVADTTRSSCPGLISKDTYSGSVSIHAWSYCFCPSHGYAVIPRMSIDAAGRCTGWIVFLGTIRDWPDTVQNRVWECDPDFVTTVYPGLVANHDHNVFAQLLWVNGVPLERIMRYQHGIFTDYGYVDLKVAALSEKITREFMGAGSNPLRNGRGWGWCKNAGMTVKMTESNIEVWAEGWSDPDKLVLDYTIPEERKIDEGNVGYMLVDVNHGGLSGISFRLEEFTPLVESLRKMNWGANTEPNQGYRFIVDVCDRPRDDVQVNASLAEAVQRLGASGAYYVGAGTKNSRASLQACVDANSGRGTVVTTDGDWYKKVSEYIEPIVNKRFTGDELYLLKGRDYSFSINGT